MRRSRESGAAFDSFPFLNVMVGMIVVLLLFIFMIISTRAMDVEEQAAVQAAIAPPTKIPGDSAQKPTLGPDGNGQGDLTNEDYEQLRRQIDELTPRIAQRRRDFERLVALRTELETRLQSLEDELILGAIDEPGLLPPGWIVGAPDPTIMVPDSEHQVSKRPRFVEVKAQEFIVHGDQKATHHPASELDHRSSAFIKFLFQIDKRRQQEYLLLLLHPNGTETYSKLRKWLLENLNETLRQPIDATTIRIIVKPRIDIGVEPFAPEWLLVNEQSQAKKK